MSKSTPAPFAATHLWAVTAIAEDDVNGECWVMIDDKVIADREENIIRQLARALANANPKDRFFVRCYVPGTCEEIRAEVRS